MKPQNKTGKEVLSMKSKNSCAPYAFRAVQTDTYRLRTVQNDHTAMKNKNILQSMRHAFDGMQAAWKAERNFREYAAIYAIFFVLNLMLGASVTEFLIGFGLVCGVFSAEYLNTALERLIDTRFPEICEDNKFIKDTAAAGVFIVSIAFFLSQGLILLPKLLEVIACVF